MRILYIISSTIMGGATLSFLTLLEEMIRRGEQAYIVIPDRKNTELIAKLESMHVRYYVIHLAFAAYPIVHNIEDLIKFPWRHLVFRWRCARNVHKIEEIIRNENINLVHTNVGPIRDGHLASKRCGIPHVWHIREYGDKDFGIYEYPTRSYFRKLLRQDYVISITEDLLSYNHLQHSSKARVIYNGVLYKDRATLEMPKKNLFLCASRLSREKNIDLVIRAFARFHSLRPDYRLVLLGLGAPGYVAYLRRVVEECSLGDSVVFEGFRSNVPDYMKKAKALVVASSAEGFGRMTAEATFLGCMVIGRNTCGTKEIIEKTGGLLFDDEDELLSSMEMVAEMSDSEYQQKALRAQKVACERFSIESYVENVYSVYKEACQS